MNFLRTAILCATLCSAAVLSFAAKPDTRDTTYIKTFPEKLDVSLYLAQNILYLDQQLETGETKEFRPNSPPNLGASIAVKNTVIFFGKGQSLNFLRDRDKGRTKSWDLQIRTYGRKIVLDFGIQRYKGFYSNDGGEITLYPDMKVTKYNFYGLYVFNHNRYSFKGAYTQKEKQLKSAGSWIAGAETYITKIRSDSSFMLNESTYLDNFQIGVNGGYAYTWVLGKYWDISLSCTLGVTLGSEQMKRFGRDRIKFAPTVYPRFSVGYSRRTWAVGLFALDNITFPAMSNTSNVAVHSGKIRLAYLKRFDLPKRRKKHAT